MLTESQARVTVVGTRRRVDLAVPARTPVGEYAHRLAALCGEPSDDALPPAWSVAEAGAAPIPLGASLASAGVLDGAVLYLRDLTERPEDTPMVEDIDELVAAETDRQRSHGLPRGALFSLLGLLWLVGAAVLLPGRFGGGNFPAAVSLVLGGLLLLGIGWALAQRGRDVPVGVPLAVALTAVPLLGGAGALLAPDLGTEVYLGVLTGAALGAAMALAAVPEAVLLAIAGQIAAVAAVAPVPALLGADPVRVAATGAVLGLILIGLAPRLAALAATRADRAAVPDGPPTVEAVTRLLIRTHRLHTLVLVGPALLLTVTLPILATSAVPYAVALSCVAGAGLLLRARLTAITPDAVLIAGPGLAGLFAVLFALVRPGTWWAVPLLVAVGAALVAAGALRSAARAGRPAPVPAKDDDYPEDPRRRPEQVLALWCTLVVAPLAMGVFGLLDGAFRLGRDLVG